jgi:hypothetical protein
LGLDAHAITIWPALSPLLIPMLNPRTEASFTTQMVMANDAALELYLSYVPFDILLFSLKDNLSFRTAPPTSVMNSRS